MAILHPSSTSAKRHRATTRSRILTEETIKTYDLTIADLKGWISAVDVKDLPLGLSVDASLEAARGLRQQIDASGRLELEDSPDTPDVLHALSRILTEQCARTPEPVLRDGRLACEFLAHRSEDFDALHEWEGLVCSFSFICWRASRLLDLSREVQHWELEYKRSFRNSADWIAGQEEWQSIDWRRQFRGTEMHALGAETIFRAVVRLQEELETDPEAVAVQSIALYRCLRDPAVFALDLRQFFQGETARLVANAFKTVGRYRNATHWLDRAESHFRSGVNPDPQLARTLLNRLGISYMLTQVEPVLRVVPTLDNTFSSLGMEDDRVKCRILWAASLKIAGQPEAALQILNSVRRVSPDVSPRLYGWILAETGLIQGICGNYQVGMEDLEEAAEIMHREKQLTGLASVNLINGFMCRSRGLLREAAELFKATVRDYQSLGMTTHAAYAQILTGETYLAMQLPREAEAEVLKALPVFEQEGVVLEAVAALGILREAIRQQKLDPEMLRELRERLRPGGN